MADAPRSALTPVEERVYHFIIDFLAQHTYQPSVREISRHCRIRSIKTVADTIESLATKGYIGRPHGRSRGVQLFGYSAVGGTIPIPQYHRANLSEPVFTAGDLARHVILDRRLVPVDDAFLLRAPDDALSERGILRGDLLLISPAGRARNGEVIAVLLGDDLLVRTVERRGVEMLLSGGASEPMVVLTPEHDYRVLGTLAGVLRPYFDRETDEPQR